jgi:hypothetical protein
MNGKYQLAIVIECGCGGLGADLNIDLSNPFWKSPNKAASMGGKALVYRHAVHVTAQ